MGVTQGTRLRIFRDQNQGFSAIWNEQTGKMLRAFDIPAITMIVTTEAGDDVVLQMSRTELRELIDDMTGTTLDG
jgi:hypothetical protein